jgi:lipopolysaccharide transport system ATP-binding protein
VTTPALAVENLVKLYRRTTPGDHFRTLKSALLEGSLTAGLKREESIAALDDVSFEVAKGEAFGVIGGNGSGKSTLLKVVAGILKPTAGRVVADGRVAALIELGAGFHPEISGRENVFINGVVLGLPKKEIERRFDSIVEFSGLGEFIDEPVKNYSSGMYVRLGFAVAVHTDPDILLVDEVLAVGDEAFAHRCLARIEELLAAGKSLLFVSHGLDLVETVCDRVLWLDRGKPRVLGSPRRVVDAYRAAVAEAEGRVHQEARQDEAPALDAEGEPLRWGSHEAEITAARLLVGAAETERYHLTTGESAVFEITAKSPRPLTDFVFGVKIETPRGIEVWGTNTELAGLAPDRFEGTATVRLELPECRLAPGEYTADVAVHTKDGTPYDYRRKFLAFTVASPERGIGLYFPSHRWRTSGGIAWR